MKCGHSTILISLSQSHPRLLYCIRAFTHALAYFNSCLNPYLYALLNRNFCCDLMEVIPSCFIRQSPVVAGQTRTSHFRDRYLLPTIIPNESFMKQKTYIEEETNCDEGMKPNTVDVGCQIELLAIHRE